MGLKWPYGLTTDDHLVGAIKNIPEEGAYFSYGNCDGKIVTLKHTIKDVVKSSDGGGKITLDNGETYYFYQF